MVKHHAIKLHTPFYADPADGTMLHRYLDEQFIPRFLQEAGNGQLSGTAQQAWRRSDRFGKHAGELPTLRLPLHRAFHVVSCEVSCDLPGDPAWDPARIISSGFVIRRGTSARARIWKMRDGVPQGWQSSEHTDLEPDEYRRLLQRGLIRARAPEPLFSGEQTYPLHPQVVTQDLGNGNTRTRTLLYGFLPLGGTVEVPLQNESAADSDSGPRLTGQLAEHEWPFGCWDGVSDTTSINDNCNGEDPLNDCCGRFDWRQDHGLQVNNGIPSRALMQLLHTLIERYHLYQAGDSSNEALRSLLGQITFRFGIVVDASKSSEPPLAGLSGNGTLLSWLDSHWEDFLDDMADWEEALQQLERESPDKSREQLIAGHPYPRLRGKSGSVDLYLSREQAETLRDLLLIRVEAAEQQVADSLPIPRFQQGEDDVYFVKPFVRYCGECGNEKFAWGPESQPFRVTSPLDPEAVRPTSIQLPELDDVKRGLARGVTFITPKSLAEQMEKIKPDLDMKKKPSSLLGACAGLTISFSIPIITICAMILLMIIIQLLNIFLRWLPWAFLKLPRWCR